MMIIRWQIIDRKHTAKSAFPGLNGADDHLSDFGFLNGCRTHKAGLQGHIKGAAVKAPVLQRLSRIPDGVEFCMAGRVMVFFHGIMSTSDDFTIFYNDSAHGHFPEAVGLLGFFQCFFIKGIHPASPFLLYSSYCSVSSASGLEKTGIHKMPVDLFILYLPLWCISSGHIDELEFIRTVSGLGKLKQLSVHKIDQSIDHSDHVIVMKVQ